MKRGITALILIVLLSSFISADIIFNEQIKPVYSIGDRVFVPVTIKSIKDISGIFQMDLICNGTPINFYKNGVKLFSGEEKSMDSSLVLIKEIIGNNDGSCKIKAIIGEEYALSNEFKISNLLIIEGGLEKTEFDSGEGIRIAGKVVKENGENSDGLIEAKIIRNEGNEDIIQFGTITSGAFDMNISLPANLRAGTYFIEMKAFEKDSNGITTNSGSINYNISVRQVPTNLELIFENKEMMPSTSLKVKAILHDQSGDQINSTAFLTIKDSSDKIIEQKEVNTDEFLDYPIKFNEPPAEWKVFAASNKLTAEDNFKIKEKELINVEIINKTILVTNTGNILYNKTLLIKIGDTPLNIQITLDVGESKKYLLSAPNGEYKVKVITGDENEIDEVMSLTGNVVGIKELSGSSLGIFIWIILILGLLIAAFIMFKKVYKKPFFGHRIFNKKESKKTIPIMNNLTVKTGDKAELSLSIKGEKQDASIICLKIKNLKEMRSKRGSISEAITKIIDLAEESKASTYENQDYLFFIFAPVKTRTFKNERAALDLAGKIQKILSEHNRMFNQKTDFGISLNYGAIIAKLEKDAFKFMSIGTLISVAKRVASLSQGEILLSEKINDLLRMQQVKTEKEMREGISVFIVKGIKIEDEATKKFINRFMERQKRG